MAVKLRLSCGMELSVWMQAHGVQAIRPGPSAVPTAAAEKKTEEDFAAFWRE